MAKKHTNKSTIDLVELLNIGTLPAMSHSELKAVIRNELGIEPTIVEDKFRNYNNTPFARTDSNDLTESIADKIIFGEFYNSVEVHVPFPVVDSHHDRDPKIKNTNMKKYDASEVSMKRSEVDKAIMMKISAVVNKQEISSYYQHAEIIVAVAGLFYKSHPSPLSPFNDTIVKLEDLKAVDVCLKLINTKFSRFSRDITIASEYVS